MCFLFWFVFFFFSFLPAGATTEAVDGHLQLLCWVLIWPKEPQLVDLVGFAKIRWHNPIPFFDLTSKQSDIGHHSSVVVKTGVKHQGLKGVTGACYRSEKSKRDIIKSTSVGVKPLSEKKRKERFSRGDSVNNCLENLFNICSKFGWYLKEVQASTLKTKKCGAREKELHSRTTTHSNTLLTWNIKHLFNLWLHSFWISIS